jgi:hypothetical protein
LIVTLESRPDELDRSYLGRLIRINGVKSQKQILDLIASWNLQPEKSRRELSSTELLASAANLDITTFIRNHSTLPLRRSIAAYRPEVVHGCKENKNMLFISGMRLARDEAYMCLECVESDLAVPGMSYWRRDHQLPGVMCCSFHGSPLQFVQNTDCFYDPPTEWIEKSKPVASDMGESTLSNPAVVQFLEMSRKLLADARPLSVDLTAGVLKTKAKQLGFHAHTGQVRLSFLSDRVIDIYPYKWLESVFPSIEKKIRGTMMTQLDGTLHCKNSASSYISYLLICGVLFDSADEAMGMLKGSTESSRIGQIAGVTKPENKLIDAYVFAKGRYADMRLYQGRLNAPTRSRLHSFGLIDFSGADAKSKFEAAKAFFVEKKSLIESAQIGGIEIDALERLIRNAGSRISFALSEIRRD